MSALGLTRMALAEIERRRIPERERGLLLDALVDQPAYRAAYELAERGAAVRFIEAKIAEALDAIG